MSAAAGLLLAPRVVFAATFTGADSALSMGSADTGQAWVITSGTGGIASNQGYFAAITTLAQAHVVTSVADGFYTITFPVIATNTRAIARAIGTGDHLFVNAEAAAWVLYKRVAGVATSLGSIATVPANGDTVGVRASGATIEVFLNGVSRLTVTETANLANVQFGWASTSTAARVDNARMVTR